MHTGGGFFGDAVNVVQHLRVSLVDVAGQVATIIQDHVGFPQFAVTVATSLLDTPHVLFFGFTFPRKDRRAGSSDGGSGVILGGEDVAGGPAHFRAQCLQSLDQHGGLDGHVDTTDDLGAFQRLLGTVLFADGDQGRHFGFGDIDFGAAIGGQGNVSDFIVGKGVRFRVHESLHSFMTNGRRSIV